MWLIVHAMIKVNPCQQKVPQVVATEKSKVKNNQTECGGAPPTLTFASGDQE